MRVAIIGGTGFVGQYLVEALQARQMDVRLLVRHGSENKVPSGVHDLVSGDISDADAVRHLLQGCDAVIYLIGILREFPARGITFDGLQHQGARVAIETAEHLGIKRFLLMSANGVKADGTAYQRSKAAAEQLLQASALDWTIFRPSVLFGDPRGKMEFATQLTDELINAPLPAPLFFPGLDFRQAGTFCMAPANVRDVAEAFAIALENSDTIGQSFALCGPEALSWKEILRILAKLQDKSKLMLPAPAIGIKTVAALFDRYECFPISRDQLTMLLEGNTCDTQPGFSHLGITPVAFDEQHLGYLRSQHS